MFVIRSTFSVLLESGELPQYQHDIAINILSISQREFSVITLATYYHMPRPYTPITNIIMIMTMIKQCMWLQHKLAIYNYIEVSVCYMIAH